MTYNVLFLCTGNTSRSIMAEAILDKEGGKRFRAFSAGSHPKGVVNPLAIKTLERAGYPTHMLHSKSWDEYVTGSAPQMDFVLTVCGAVAGEICPLWPGSPTAAHWGIPDPAAVEGTEKEKEAAFQKAFNQLKTRISAFVELPLETLDRGELLVRLRAIRQLS